MRIEPQRRYTDLPVNTALALGTWVGALGGVLAFFTSSPASAQEFPVTLTSEPGGLVLHGVKQPERSPAYGAAPSFPEYTQLCTAPCKLTLPAGKHDFGVSLPGSSPIVVHDVIIAPHPMHLALRYHDRSSQRAVAYGFGVLGAVTGTLFVYTGTHGGSSGTEHDPLLIGMGLAIGGVAAVGTLVFALINLDSAEVVPSMLTVSVPTRRVPPGFALAKRF